MRVTLGGADVDLLHHDEILAEVRHHLRHSSEPLALTFATLEHLYHFGVDSGRAGAFDRARGGPDWRILVDNAAVIRKARSLTGVWWEPLRPDDLVPDVLGAAARERARVGIVGGNRAQVAMLSTVLSEQYPDLRTVHTWIPDRDQIARPESARALATDIASLEVDLLLVALGKPRQERWIDQQLATTGAGVTIAVGSATRLLHAVGVPSRMHMLRERLASLVHEPATAVRRLVRDPANLIRLVTQSPSEQLSRAARALRPSPLLASPASWRRRVARALLTADAAVIALSSFIAYSLRSVLGRLGSLTEFQSELPVALAVIPLWLTILYGVGSYRPERFSRGGDALRRFVAGGVLGVFALGFVSFALNLQLSRIYVLVLSLLVLVSGVVVRVAARRFVEGQHERGRLMRNVLIVGVDDESLEVAAAMHRSPTAGYRVVGVLDDSRPVGATVGDGFEVLGRPHEVLDAAYDHRAGLVVVAPSAVAPGTLREVTIELEGSLVDLAVAPSLFEVVAQRVTVESIDNVPILHVDQVRLRGLRAVTKRTVDIVVAGLLLAFLWPGMLVAAAAIRIESGKPALFRQVRVGREGVPFTMLKFRTMVPDAEERLEEVAALNEAGHRFFKIREDPRVTRVGRFLRKWSIDETPQLWNVLRGNMSMVGPRPAIPEEVEKYEPWHRRRLRVRPGVTGIWQVSGRSDVHFDEAVRMDLFYIENWSLSLDLMLLAKTVPAVLGRRGAY